MTVLTIEPLHDDFGARVTGVALSGDLRESDLASIRRATSVLMGEVCAGFTPL